MSFWKSFFGAMAAAEISEKKKAEQERARQERDGLNNAQKVFLLGVKFIAFYHLFSTDFVGCCWQG